MKHKKIVSLCSIAFLGIAAVSGALFAKQKTQNNLKVEAKIDITDYTACNEKYESKDAAGLLSALRTITSPGSDKGYDYLWTIYKTCYKRADGKIFDYYSSITNYRPGTDQAGSYSKEGDCYNREHSIPQSWWGSGTSNQGADAFIVVPTDGYVNGARSNFPFGMVQNVSVRFSNSKKGTADISWGYSGIVFEPDDSVKGDFARIYFYAIAKYSGAYNWNKDYGGSCFSGNNSAASYFGLTPYAIKLFSYWSHLDPVSEWEMSVNNKVSAIQGNRNPFIDHPEYADVLWGNYGQYTPYIQQTGITLSSTSLEMTTGSSRTLVAYTSDQSDVTWSVGNSSVVTINKTSTTSGGALNVVGVGVGSTTVTASAVIDGDTYTASCSFTVTQSTDPTVHVTSVQFLKKELTMYIGDVKELKYVVNPTNAANKNVYFHSEDPYIAYFKSGATVVAYDVGRVTMTVTTIDGGFSDTCVITVKKAKESSGCGGNIMTTSVVLSTLSMLGIGLLLIKRLHKSK